MSVGSVMVGLVIRVIAGVGVVHSMLLIMNRLAVVLMFVMVPDLFVRGVVHGLVVQAIVMAVIGSVGMMISNVPVTVRMGPIIMVTWHEDTILFSLMRCIIVMSVGVGQHVLLHNTMIMVHYLVGDLDGFRFLLGRRGWLLLHWLRLPLSWLNRSGSTLMTGLIVRRLRVMLIFVFIPVVAMHTVVDVMVLSWMVRAMDLVDDTPTLIITAVTVAVAVTVRGVVKVAAVVHV